LLTAATIAAGALPAAGGTAMLVPNGKLVAARATINGSGPYVFVLDTGASYTIVDAALAKRLHLKLGERITSVGAGGEFTTRELSPIRMTAGSAAYMTRGARAANINDPARPHIDGIVGYDFFSQFAVTVDRSKHQITMVPNDEWTAPACDWIPITFHRHWPYVPVTITIAGKASKRNVLFDTGSEDEIDSDAVTRAPGRKSITAGVGLGDRRFTAYSATVDAVVIGHQRVTNVTGVGSNDLQAIWLLGSGISQHFNYTLDYAGRRLCLMAR
jgi:hypothetical protein